MSYNCDICNYTTNDSGNFSRHKKTKKHIEIMVKKDISKNKNTEISLKLANLNT